MSEQTETDHNIAIWKVKSLVKSLSAARGNGTSLVSLIIPPGGQISQMSALMTQEFGAASNIKSRVTRQAVQSAITSARQRLTLYNSVPPNGLVIYCGDITLDDGKQKKVAFDFEPFKPINTSIYRCDSRFITEPLAELLQDNASFGFIVMDGNGSLFGTLAGNTKNILYKFTVDLPKKHGRGGQSALRFSRLRDEARHNYVRKVAEHATKFFIENDLPNVGGLVLAGSADFKTDLSKSDMFDPRLGSKILKIVDISYGGENGFNQAIDLAADALANVKFVAEKKLISKFLEEIAQNTNKICYGQAHTFKALEMGAVETLIVWEDLETLRITLRNPRTSEEIIVNISPAEESKGTHLKDQAGADLEVVEKVTLIEWFAEVYKKFGANLEFVTDKSQEGNQFAAGFGGVGGLLRYPIDLTGLDGVADDDEYYQSDDDVM